MILVVPISCFSGFRVDLALLVNTTHAPRDPSPRPPDASVYSTMSATQLSHPFDSFESQQKSSIPAFLHMRMADLVPMN